jgi:hypothetical protein
MQNTKTVSAASKRARGSVQDADETMPPETEPLDLQALRLAYCGFLADQVTNALDDDKADNEFVGRQDKFQVLPDTTMRTEYAPLFVQAPADGQHPYACIFMHPRQYALLRDTQPLVLTYRWVHTHKFTSRYDGKQFTLVVELESIGRDLQSIGSLGLILMTTLNLSEAYFVGCTPCATRRHMPLRPRRPCPNNTAVSCLDCHDRVACSDCATKAALIPSCTRCAKCAAAKKPGAPTAAVAAATPNGK